jgi:hypothetical protein
MSNLNNCSYHRYVQLGAFEKSVESDLRCESFPMIDHQYRRANSPHSSEPGEPRSDESSEESCRMVDDLKETVCGGRRDVVRRRIQERHVLVVDEMTHDTNGPHRFGDHPSDKENSVQRELLARVERKAGVWTKGKGRWRAI